MIEIDGTYGEGGGQILRTSLALSLVTGKPFTIKNIRGNRKRTGLLRQHFTTVNAAKEIGDAEVKGASISSQTLFFEPKVVSPGSYRFSVGSAGSAMLVLQSILPALMLADETSEIIVEGGTHNPWAPPFHFIQDAFVPCLKKMGYDVDIELNRFGFYPAGGGQVKAVINPVGRINKVNLNHRGEVKVEVLAQMANISEAIAIREASIVATSLDLPPERMKTKKIRNSVGPGNVVTVHVESEHITEVLTGFGEKGVPAKKVAKNLVKEVRGYLAADVPVGEHLADQLLIPMALGKGGSFTTVKPTLHTETNIEVIKQFLDVDIKIEQMNEKAWSVVVAPA